VRTIHQSSISGCYPSLDYLLARRSYPRRASSLFAPRLVVPVARRPSRLGESWSPPSPVARLPRRVAGPDPGEPASWLPRRQQAGCGTAVPPANRRTCSARSAPTRRSPTIPSCGASAARCGRRGGLATRRKRRAVRTPEPLRCCRHRVGFPTRRLEPTDCPPLAERCPNPKNFLFSKDV